MTDTSIPSLLSHFPSEAPLVPVINPDGGSLRLPFGIGGAGLTLPSLPGLGGLWNALWWAALGYAVYKGVRRVPPSRVGSSAALPAAVAALVMGFASDRAARSSGGRVAGLAGGTNAKAACRAGRTPTRDSEGRTARSPLLMAYT